MKKIIFIAISILTISNNSFSQGDWYWIHPNPQGQDLFDCQFINPQVGFACGDGGIVMKTTNGGMNWKVFNTGTNNEFLSVYFLNELTGIAVGGYYSSLIRKTTDGGNSWITKDSSISSGYRSVYFTDSVTGYAVGGGGRIRKTINAGENWFSLNSLKGGTLYKIKFYNKQNGFIFSGSSMRTTNAGNSWTFYDMQFSDAAFLDSVNWYGLKSDGAVFKTTNGGINWSGQYTGTGDVFKSIFFLNENTGFIAGDNYIRRTINGGNTWTSQSFTNSGFKCITFYGENLGVAVGETGIMYNTTNQGNSWNNLQQSVGGKTDLNSIFFLNEYTGFVAGGGILKTTDGGSTWMTRSSGYNYVNNSIDFTDDLTGYAAASNGKILKTTNGGDNWFFISPVALVESPKVIKFVNTDAGFTASTNGSIYKTGNAGLSWVRVLAPTSSALNSLFFINEITGYAAGNGGVILKTTNYGTNWSSLSTGTTNGRNTVFFTDSLAGYSSGSNDVIKTTNAGLSWFPIVQNLHTLYASIFFTNSTTGYCIKRFSYNNYISNSILRTVNGGINWTSQNLQTDFYVTSLFFVNPELGFACGEKGSIFYSNSGGLVNYNYYEIQIPNKFILSQNYPNPFNPNTVISYSLIENGFVKLKVYDVLGNEIATLVNEKQNAGSYNYQFSTGYYQLASGIYFYKLETENQSFSKRMMLLK